MLEDLCFRVYTLDQLWWKIWFHDGSKAVPITSPVTSERCVPSRLGPNSIPVPGLWAGRAAPKHSAKCLQANCLCPSRSLDFPVSAPPRKAAASSTVWLQTSCDKVAKPIFIRVGFQTSVIQIEGDDVNLVSCGLLNRHQLLRVLYQNHWS